MSALREFAYGIYLGPFPMIAIMGFVTYSLVATAALLAWARRRIKRVRRIPIRLHRWLGFAAVVAATFHLLLGLAIYV
jgi:predicted ferric reductase